MTSRTTKRFRRAFSRLPHHIQQTAGDCYKLFAQDPHHPRLQFRQVHPTKPIFSVRITRDYRALGVRDADTMIWFWIGSHADYDRLLAQL